MTTRPCLLGFLFLWASQLDAFVLSPPPLQVALPATARSQLHEPRISTALFNHHGHEEAAFLLDLNQLGVFGQLMQDPIFWSTAIMVSIVALLFSWEKTIASARQALPVTLQPVVDSMLVEMGGLGFIGLFLSIAVIEGPLGSLIGYFSEQFLGDEEILLESFEFLHAAFFEVAVAFFLIAAMTVASVVKQVESLETVSRAVFDIDGDGEVTLLEVATVLNVEAITVDLDGDGVLSDEEISYALTIAPRPTIWTEVMKSQEDERAESLLVRERLVQEYGIQEKTFQLEKYFVKIFGKNLEEMVELSPLTWLPLIPVVAQGRSIDLSRDIVSASSANAYESCGEFLSTPGFFEAQTLSVSLSLVWGMWNFWKMVEIKNMLIPTLVLDTHASNPKDGAVLLPPRYEDEAQMKQFNSSPFPFHLVEQIWGKPARNNQEALFGAAGRAGPHLYQNSIKLHTWFVVAQLVFIVGQIVVRDASALLEGPLPASIAHPELVLPELGLYGFYASLLAGLLWLVPKTFLDFSLVTSIERLIDSSVLSEACVMDGECLIEYNDDDDNLVAIPTNTPKATTELAAARHDDDENDTTTTTNGSRTNGARAGANGDDDDSAWSKPKNGESSVVVGS